MKSIIILILTIFSFLALGCQGQGTDIGNPVAPDEIIDPVPGDECPDCIHCEDLEECEEEL